MLRTAAPMAGPLVSVVSCVAGISEEAAKGLIALGAVWYGDWPQGPAGPLKWRRAATLLVGSDSDSGQAHIAAGVPVKVHTAPKRFPACSETDWCVSMVSPQGGPAYVSWRLRAVLLLSYRCRACRMQLQGRCGSACF